MRADEETIKAIKRVRREKGLSQSELGHRVGVPQSHISKIEKGDVDIKLSSLIQIARALDLEVKLVPKKALPAVDSIVRAFPQDKTAAALSEIRKTLTFLDRLGQAPELPDKLHDHLRTINQHLQGLRTLRFGTDAYLRLQQKLRQIRKIAAPLDPSNITWDAALAKDRTAPQVEKLARSAGDLKSLHTDLAQRAAQRDPLDLPAYSLDHDDE